MNQIEETGSGSHYDWKAIALSNQAEIERLRSALADLVSWFPDKPSEPEWRLKGGEHGADDAVAFARAALSGSEDK